MPVAANQQIAEHRGILEQFDVLERARDAELCDRERRRFGDFLVLEIDPAGGRAVNARDQVEDRTFLGAVWFDDREYLTLFHRDGDGIALLQAAEIQRAVYG